jgi:hypothetical protein
MQQLAVRTTTTTTTNNNDDEADNNNDDFDNLARMLQCYATIIRHWLTSEVNSIYNNNGDKNENDNNDEDNNGAFIRRR